MESKLRKPVPGVGWTKNKSSTYSCLCEAVELPSWHFQHRGIRKGYRSTCDTFSKAFYSLFRWHNESFNIWSHYVAAIYCVGLFIYMTDYGNDLKGPLLDNVILIGTLITGIFFPLFSSGYCHHFYCIDQEWHRFCWFFDFTGLLTGMLSGGICYVYFTLYCFKTIALAYIIFLSIGYSYAYYWCWNKYSVRMKKDNLLPRDRFPEFSFSLSTYVTFASFIPVACTFLLKEYVADPRYITVYKCSILTPVLLSIGIVVFAQGNVPERFCKLLKIPENFFDMLGHSHQLWHITSATVLIIFTTVIVDHYKLRISHQCQ